MDELLHLHGRIKVQDFGGAFGPAFVQNHIFDAVFGGKINVIFIGGGVETRPKIHAKDVVGIVPIPGHLAGFYPTPVGFGRWIGKQKGQVAFDEGFVVADDENAPGEVGHAFGECNVVCLLSDDLVAVGAVLFVWNGFQHHSWKNGFEQATRLFLHKEVGIMVQGCFREQDFAFCWRFKKHRKAAEAAVAQAGNVLVQVAPFVVRIHALLFRKPGLAAFRHREPECFLFHNGGHFKVVFPLVSHTIVIHTETDAKTGIVLQQQFVGMIVDDSVFVRNIRMDEDIGDRSFRMGDHTCECLSLAICFEANPGFGNDLSTLMHH